ncbi:MAG TPA: hypothetical protein VGI55_15410 [Solirubrobacteraceae bacterium]
MPPPVAGGRGVPGGPLGGLERWRPSMNITRPIKTTPSPMSTQPQAGRPLLLDCSELVLDVGN